MKNILVMLGSNSSTSINKHVMQEVLKQYQAANFIDSQLIALDIKLFSQDIENQMGLPKDIQNLHQQINHADGVLIFCPEHNSNYPAYFKNIIDWLSRVDNANIFNNIPVAMIAVTPGKRAGLGVRTLFEDGFVRFKGDVVGSYGVKNFNGILLQEDANNIIELIHQLVER